MEVVNTSELLREIRHIKYERVSINPYQHSPLSYPGREREREREADPRGVSLNTADPVHRSI